MNLPDTGNRYGVIAMALHWGTALLTIGMFSLGLYMGTLSYYDSLYLTLPAIHKSGGAILLLIIIVRLAWRKITVPPPSLRTHAHWEGLAARTVHTAFYLLLFAMAFTGYLISTADGRPLLIFGDVAIPALITGEHLEDKAGAVHRILAFTLIILAVLHAGAALKHHFFDRDRTLLRMLGR
jgi:cytochrome b561